MLQQEKGDSIRMKRRKLCALVLAAALSGLTACSGGEKEEGTQTKKQEPVMTALENGEVSLQKSTGGNPLVGDSDTGDYQYGGDPSVLVDGDTVYLYTGHDLSTDSEVKRAIYNIPEYVCYSTKDMKNWKSEGTVMKVSTDEVDWVTSSTTAWASQVVKHRDGEAGKDRCYLYYCSWDKTSSGKQSIGVAVADSPTGPFKDIGKPLVQGTLTEPQRSNWDDIDPTVWVETDDSGEEHRYLAWGNSQYYICELNEDMISVKDLNGDGKITCGMTPEEADVLHHQTGLTSFTEAPWIYRRKDAEGKYYGKYYLFYAYGWRERMAYATTDDLLTGSWKFGSVLMPPTATSNTNHMAVFDFKGKTYFAYHNGSLPGGNGYRRSACITELRFDDKGKVEVMSETAAGLNGTIMKIRDGAGNSLFHENFMNSGNDQEYPYKDIAVLTGTPETDRDAEWVLTKGKADPGKDAFVSIQSENKPGLYLTAGEDGTVTLAQDTDASEAAAKRQTFRTVAGMADAGGVSFESISQPGKYLTVKEQKLCLTDGSDKKTATFYVDRKEK